MGRNMILTIHRIASGTLWKPEKGEVIYCITERDGEIIIITSKPPKE